MDQRTSTNPAYRARGQRAQRGRQRAFAVLAAAAVGLPFTALAHHGFGRFDRSKPVVLTGVITRMEFVNPHSYLHFEAVQPDGETIAMRCEMRAATLLRRSGWKPEMFAIGAKVTVRGFAHRDDPHSCYLEDVKIGDGAGFNRNDQFSTRTNEAKRRPLRRPSGEPNISGDWAQEQYVIAVPPGGKGAALVPKHLVAAVEAGTIAIADTTSAGWGPRPVTLTARGRKEAEAFRMWSPEDNPRLRCRPTSIILDWVFDGPVNRIEQHRDRIVIHYGLYSFARVIHMNMDAHPAHVQPSYAGHSIGHWDGDVLVVDTIGFEPGVLAPPIRNSSQLHVVERFSLDPKTGALRRDYVATDPVYFRGQYVGSDTVLPADVPYEPRPCKELTYEFNPDVRREEQAIGH